MASLFLCLLLFVLPATASPPDDDGDDSRDDEEAVATHARPALTNSAVPPLNAQPFHVWVNFGYGSVDQYFDDDGERRDLGVFDPDGSGPVQAIDTNAKLASFIVHLGGAYDVYRDGDRAVKLGADLGLSRRTLTADAIAPAGIRETDASSGFAPQNLTVFSEFSAPTYSVRAGYLLDLGPEDDPNDAEDYTNSDEQDALQLGLSGQYPTESYRLYGGLDYFLTLEGERGPYDTEFDEGNILNLHAGGALRFAETFEVGVTLLYRINAEGHIGGVDGNDLPAPASQGAPNEVAGGSALGLVPHLSYTAAESPLSGGSPVQVFAKGALQREYQDYGYTFSGNDDIAPTLGVTVGVNVGL